MADFLDQLRASAAAAAFPLEGELAVSGPEAPVEILRDRYGVAYVSAGSLDDLWFAQGLVAAGERLFQLDLALKKIDDGTFGICEICEEPIGKKRLEARPETTLCIKCKEDQEREERTMG